MRALAGRDFSAEPRPGPTRLSRARLRHPSVADGTSVPLALAVDDGSGGVTFCRVTVPSGSSLATLLATADGSEHRPAAAPRAGSSPAVS